jgi:TonB family protein
MRRASSSLVLGLAGACAVTGAAFAQPVTLVAGFKPIVINARKDQEPKPGTAASLYPEKARKAGIEGTVMLHCQIQPEARVSACTVVDEDPPNWGFADVALRTTRLIRQPVPLAGNKVATQGVAIVSYDFILGDASHRTESVPTGQWAQKPGVSEMGSAYPTIAQRSFVQGFALIDCRVMADGGLESCRPDVEEPARYGFAEAAMSLTPKFKMRMTRADGTIVQPGGQIRIPFLFRLPFIPH